MQSEIIRMLDGLADKIKMRILTGEEVMLILRVVAEMIRDGSAFEQ